MKSTLHILFILLVLFLGKGVQAQMEPNTFAFEDPFENTIKIMDVVSLPKELDTSFFRNTFTGQLFSDSVKSMYINIYAVKKEKGGVYDIRLTLIVKEATVEQIMEQYGYKHFTLECRKGEIYRFNYSHSEI